MSLKIDLDSIVNGKNDQTNFTSELLRLIMKSDMRHRAMIRTAFPNEVRIFEHWHETGEILDLPYS